MAVRGQNTKGEVQALLGELVAVREELSGAEGRFSVVPADTLLDLPAHPAAPENLSPRTQPPPPTSSRALTRHSAVASANRNGNTLSRFAAITCQPSFDARIRAAQDRIINIRVRERLEPEFAIARQRAQRPRRSATDAHRAPGGLAETDVGQARPCPPHRYCVGAHKHSVRRRANRRRRRQI